MLSTTEKGEIGETALVPDLTMLGFPVSVPIAGDIRYDLIADLSNGLTRVQVKHERTASDHVVAELKRTNPTHNDAKQSDYSADEIDASAIQASDLDRSFWLPFEEAPGSKVRIRHASDSEIDHPSIRWAEECALARRLG